MITSPQNRATTGKLLALTILLAAKPSYASTTFTVNSTADHADAILGLDASFTFSTKKAIRLGQNITATATGPSGTSEFSAPRKVVAQ